MPAARLPATALAALLPAAAIAALPIAALPAAALAAAALPVAALRRSPPPSASESRPELRLDLQPCVSEAAALCGGGCSHMHTNLHMHMHTCSVHARVTIARAARASTCVAPRSPSARAAAA